MTKYWMVEVPLALLFLGDSPIFDRFLLVARPIPLPLIIDFFPQFFLVNSQSWLISSP